LGDQKFQNSAKKTTSPGTWIDKATGETVHNDYTGNMFQGSDGIRYYEFKNTANGHISWTPSRPSGGYVAKDVTYYSDADIREHYGN
jgi:hypothetical protein